MTVLFGETILSSAGMQNGKLSVSVSANDLIVAVKTLAGSDPSSSDPVYVRIGDTLRSITSALSITIVDGTNWFNAGGAELATQTVPYFVYLLWDSNSSAVALTIGRKSHYREVASGMSTTTSENHIYGYSGFTDGDDMVNVGYFEATLSAGAGYTWTVPTFTGDNLKSEPTYFSRWMTWTPTHTGFSAAPTVTRRYRVLPHTIEWSYAPTAYGTSNATGYTFTLPFSITSSFSAPAGRTRDNTAFVATGSFDIFSAPSATVTVRTAANGTWTASGEKGVYIPITTCEI